MESGKVRVKALVSTPQRMFNLLENHIIDSFAPDNFPKKMNKIDNKEALHIIVKP